MRGRLLWLVAAPAAAAALLFAVTAGYLWAGGAGPSDLVLIVGFLSAWSDSSSWPVRPSHRAEHRDRLAPLRATPPMRRRRPRPPASRLDTARAKATTAFGEAARRRPRRARRRPGREQGGADRGGRIPRAVTERPGRDRGPERAAAAGRGTAGPGPHLGRGPAGRGLRQPRPAAPVAGPPRDPAPRRAGERGRGPRPAQGPLPRRPPRHPHPPPRREPRRARRRRLPAAVEPARSP